MATINIGALEPVNLDDKQLEAYRQRVQSGEDANQVAIDFFRTAWNEIDTAQKLRVQNEGRVLDGTQGPDDLARKYGFTTYGNAAIMAGARTAQDTPVQALAALLGNTPPPTVYAPGSLQPGSANYVGKTWATPEKSLDQSINPINVNNPNDPGQLAYNQRLAAMNPTTQSTVPALGTPEYTNYLVQQGKALGMNLDQYKVPTSADQASVGGTPLKVPAPTYQAASVSEASSLMAGVDASAKSTNDLIAVLTKQIEDSQKAMQGAESNKSGLFDKLLGTKPDTQALIQQYDQIYGLQQQMAEKTKVRQEYAALEQEYVTAKSQMDAQIAAAEGAMASTGFISRKEAEIRRRYEPELNRISGLMNAKASYLAMVNQDVNQAIALSNRMVEAITADAKWDFDYYSTLIQDNQESISRMDTKYQNALNQALDLSKWNYEQSKSAATQKANMIIDLAKQGIDASHLATASIEQISQFAADNARNTINYMQEQRLGGGSGGGSVSRNLSSDAQNYLDGIITDEDFGNSGSDRDYLRQVKAEANKIAQSALNTGSTPTQPTTYAPAQPKTYSVGKSLGQDLAPLVQGPANLVKGITNTVGSFFSGLFGR